MRPTKLIPAIASLGLTLAACTNATTPASSTPPAPTILSEVQQVCAEALPLASLVPAVGVYATAFCAADNLATAALTPADLSWISNVAGELKGNAMPVAAAPKNLAQIAR